MEGDTRAVDGPVHDRPGNVGGMDCGVNKVGGSVTGVGHHWSRNVGSVGEDRLSKVGGCVGDRPRNMGGMVGDRGGCVVGNIGQA